MQIEDTGDRVVVRLGSRKACDVGDDLRSLAETHLGRTLELDMGEVPIINADALSVLIRLNAQSGKDGGRLLLSHVQGFVRAVFRVTKTETLFEIIEEEGEPTAAVN